jgi:hypothetical protein
LGFYFITLTKGKQMARTQRVDSFEHKGYLICQLRKACIVLAGKPLPERCWWFVNAIRAEKAIDNGYLEEKTNEPKEMV